MRYGRFLALLLIFTTMFSLISCHGMFYPGHGQGNHVNQNTPSTDEEQGGEGYVTFYYSVNSDRYHIAECYHVYAIGEKFMKTTTDVAALTADGYSPCEDCIAIKEEPDDNENVITREEATYVIGKGNNKLHKLDCHNLDKMYEENMIYTNLSIEMLMALDKYPPCKDCLPDEAEIYYAKHPEKDPANKTDK